MDRFKISLAIIVILVIMLSYTYYTREAFYYSPKQVETVLMSQRTKPLTIHGGKIVDPGPPEYRYPGMYNASDYYKKRTETSQTIEDLYGEDDMGLSKQVQLNKKAVNSVDATNMAVESMISDYSDIIN